jgi:hypothetical protein
MEHIATTTTATTDDQLHHGPRTAWLKPSELKCYDGDDEWCQRLPERPVRGTVGYVGIDRGPDTNLFVVIDHDAERNTYTLAFPRIKAVKGRLVLGQDKLAPAEVERRRAQRELASRTCKCPRPPCTYIENAGCACGAWPRVTRSAYRKLFRSVRAKGAPYVVRTFVFPTKEESPFVHALHAKTADLASLDEPLVLCGGSEHPMLFCCASCGIH